MPRLLLLAACATVKGSVSLGPDASEWVYIDSTNPSDNGVYRCKETEKGPVCWQAKLVTR